MNQSIKTISLVVLGVVAGLSVSQLFSNESIVVGEDNAVDKPLYWVAPMDDNYRRDKPGKSPIGYGFSSRI